MVGFTMLTRTTTICPDPKCQKLVEEKFEQEKKKLEEIRENFTKRAIQRAEDGKIARAAKAKAKLSNSPKK